MQPVHLENDFVTVRPLGAIDLRHSQTLADEVYALLTDRRTLRYLPEKRLPSKKAAESWLATTLMNLHCGGTIHTSFA
jgi:hypothetical protein